MTKKKWFLPFSIEISQKISRTKGCVLTGFVFSKRDRFAHTQKAKNCKLATLRQAVFLTPFTNRSRLFSENTAECQATPLAPDCWGRSTRRGINQEITLFVQENSKLNLVDRCVIQGRRGFAPFLRGGKKCENWEKYFCYWYH